MESLTTAGAGGIALGISTGLSCLTWCIPALGPHLATQPDGARRGVMAAVEFNAGRMSGYGLVFGAAAVLGRLAPDAPWIRPAAAVSMLALGILMLLYAAHVNFPAARVCRADWYQRLAHRLPIVAGLLVGVSPCPPLMAAAAAVVGAGLGSTVVFGLAFFLGTSLFILPLGLLSHQAIRKRLRTTAEIGAVFAGLWFLAHGVVGLTS